MAKVFYTEHDIEDMVKRGERSLVVTNDVVLTDLAYEMARRLGVQLVQPTDTPPAAPIRPYINKTASPAAVQTPAAIPATPVAAPAAGARVAAIKARVKAAVLAQLGSSAVDEATLDRIIERVAADLGLK
ncbi:MAG: hypothetical protein HPY72_04310 [Anaerolineae bacterium]|nr:hypothetical protein [Anaerolineae bacterium]